MFYFLAGWLKSTLRQGVRFIRGGKKLNYFTTNDLDRKGKLKPDYLEDRKRRKKERKESGEDDFC